MQDISKITAKENSGASAFRDLSGYSDNFDNFRENLG